MTDIKYRALGIEKPLDDAADDIEAWGEWVLWLAPIGIALFVAFVTIVMVAAMR